MLLLTAHKLLMEDFKKNQGFRYLLVPGIWANAGHQGFHHPNPLILL